MDCQSLGSSRARGKRPFSERHAVTLPCTTSITGTTIKRDNPEQGSNCSQYIYYNELPIGTGDFAKSIWVFVGVADSGSGVAHRWSSFVAAMGVWRDISSSEDEEEEKLSIPMRIFQLF